MISLTNLTRKLGTRAFLLATILLGGLMAACASSDDFKASGQERRFEMRGRVVSVDKRNREAVVAHEEIPGFMEAMTMPFTVKDTWVLDTVGAGDTLQATLVVDLGRSWLENAAITKGTATGAAAMQRTKRAAMNPGAGDELPDVKLVNQDGKRISPRGYRDRALLITFIYTRCPLPDYCPLMSSKFAEIDKELDKSERLRDRAHLLSVTLDPAYDTPKVLRSYGAAYTENFSQETFANWEFATGDAAEIKRLAQFFGLEYFAEKDQIVHSLRTALIAPDGRLFKIYRGNEWKPINVVRDIEVVLKDTNPVQNFPQRHREN